MLQAIKLIFIDCREKRSSNMSENPHVKLLDLFSADDLEKILLEKRLREYAFTMLELNEPLDVQDLFEPQLSDSGFEKLSDIMMFFPESYVYAVATRIFEDVGAFNKKID